MNKQIGGNELSFIRNWKPSPKISLPDIIEIEIHIVGWRGHRTMKSTDSLCEDGFLGCRSVYSHDGDSAKLKEERVYSLRDGSLLGKISYTYNATKNLTKEAWYAADELLFDEINYSDYE